MNFKRTLLIIGLSAIIFATSVGLKAYAGGGFDPPPWCTTIQGPELWGVVIMDNCVGAPSDPPCSPFGALRVKRIKECNVETFSSASPWTTDFPDDETDPINMAFQGQSFFSDIQGSAIIRKVKNFQIDGGRHISFDAQFKFCAP